MKDKTLRQTLRSMGIVTLDGGVNYMFNGRLQQQEFDKNRLYSLERYFYMLLRELGYKIEPATNVPERLTKVKKGK